MMHASIFSLVVVASAGSADDCRDSMRADPLNTAAAKVETTVRTGAGDPCPDKAAVSTDAKQSELLEFVRYRTLQHIEGELAKTYRIDRDALRSKFLQMRVALALRHSSVRVDRGTLVVEPELQSAHAGDFAKLAALDPDDVARLNASIGARVARANSKFKNDGDRRAGPDLMAELRQTGADGYQGLVAADPSLLYVREDGDVEAAAKTFRRELQQAKDDLPKLSLNPPYGKGVGLIFVTGVTAEAVTERPDLCGAFNALLTKARRMRRAQEAVSLGVSSVEGLCVKNFVVKLISWPTAACAAAGAVARQLANAVPGANFKRMRMLYGGPIDVPSARPGAQVVEVK